MTNSLSIGLSALNTAQAGLRVTSHNIANVNTEGYDRQRMTQSALYYGNTVNGHQVGSGVEVNSIERVYDQFANNKLNDYANKQADAERYNALISEAADLMNQPLLNVHDGLDQFFSSVNDVTNDPTSLAAREFMLSQGEA